MLKVAARRANLTSLMMNALRSCVVQNHLTLDDGGDTYTHTRTLQIPKRAYSQWLWLKPNVRRARSRLNSGINMSLRPNRTTLWNSIGPVPDAEAYPSRMSSSSPFKMEPLRITSIVLLRLQRTHETIGVGRMARSRNQYDMALLTDIENAKGLEIGLASSHSTITNST
jgi:hypothetical protein